MIVFSPNYDEATASNAAVVSLVCDEADDILSGFQATTCALGGLLRSTNAPLFAMCHGAVDGLFVQNGVRCATLSVDSLRLKPISARSVFAHACYSARELGRLLAQQGCVYIGYDKPVNAPESDGMLLSTFAAVFSFIKNTFWRLGSPSDVADFFAALECLCQAARDHIDAAYDGGAVLSAHQCLIQIQNDLRVWRPGQSAPEVSPHAGTPFFL